MEIERERGGKRRRGGERKDEEHRARFVSRFEKRGHFAPDLNFETLICTEITESQLSFAAFLCS